jgi:3-deoxy-D-arabino-heptulosonate 7-phosphate (DAHP) synthase class II
MTRSIPKTDWHPASWQALPAAQQPTYPDQAALERAVGDLSRLPPLVTSWEIDALKDEIARAQRGEAFILQGGDCAETFDECTSENIVAKLKILLQMSLVIRRANGGAVCQAAVRRHRNAGGPVAAEFSRRPGQPKPVHTRGSRTGP